MAMGICSDLDFVEDCNNCGAVVNLNRELDKNNSSDTETRASVELMKRGRGNKKELPECLRVVIGEEAILGNNQETARAFGISQSSVSAYKNGASSTSSYNDNGQSLKPKIADVKSKIQKRATRTLLQAINSITEEKLADAKVRDLAGIARDMSSVVKNMETETDHGPAVQFTFYAPKQKEISDYEVIDVSSGQF